VILTANSAHCLKWWRIAWRLIVVSTLACVFLSRVRMTPDEQFMHQRIPIEIQGGKPAIIEIRSLSGNGWNKVGVRASPEAWNALTNGAPYVTIRLIPSNRNGTQIIDQGSFDRPKLRPIESFHYLFTIGGEYRANASVEITFPIASPQVTRIARLRI